MELLPFLREIGLLLLTLLIATGFGLLALRFKITAGGMVGAMVGVAIFQLITGIALVPPWARRVMQVLSGALIGSRILRKDVLTLGKLAVPLAILLPALLIVNILLGIGIHYISGLRPATALFGCAPGGLADIGLIAADMGADIGLVSIMQLVRLFGVISIFPPIFKSIAKRQADSAARKPALAEASPEKEESLTTIPSPPRPLAIKRALLTLGISALGGVLFYYLGVPAGAMVGAMVAVAVFSVATGSARFPNGLRLPVQIISGAYIGSMMTRDQVMMMPSLALPLLMIIAGLFVCSFGIGYLLHKMGKLDLQTSFLAAAPGGLQEMSLLAEELGCDSMKVTILQTVRLFTVVLIFPAALTLITNLLG